MKYFSVQRGNRRKWWTEVSKTYEMPKKYVRIGKPRELSPAQKENLENIRDKTSGIELKKIHIYEK